MSIQNKKPNEIHDPSEPWDNPTLLNNRPSHTGELWRKAKANIEQSQRNFVAPNILRSRNLNFIRESQRTQNNPLEKNSNSKFPQPVKKVGMEGGEGDNEDHSKKSKKNDHKPADAVAKNPKQKVKRKIVLFILPYFFGFIGIASIFMMFLVAINIDWCDVAGVVAGDGIAGGAVRISCNLLSPGPASASIQPQSVNPRVNNGTTGAGNSRADRNNNPAAITYSAQYVSALTRAGYVEGRDFWNPQDNFTDSQGRTYSTMKFVNAETGINATIALIDDIGFYRTDTGGQRWDYIAMPQSQWMSLSPTEKRNTIERMYVHENGRNGNNMFASN